MPADDVLVELMLFFDLCSLSRVIVGVVACALRALGADCFWRERHPHPRLRYDLRPLDSSLRIAKDVVCASTINICLLASPVIEVGRTIHLQSLLRGGGPSDEADMDNTLTLRFASRMQSVSIGKATKHLIGSEE